MLLNVFATDSGTLHNARPCTAAPDPRDGDYLLLQVTMPYATWQYRLSHDAYQRLCAGEELSYVTAETVDVLSTRPITREDSGTAVYGTGWL